MLTNPYLLPLRRPSTRRLARIAGIIRGSMGVTHHDFDWDVADRIVRYKPDEAIAIWLRIIKWNNHPDQVSYWHIGRALNNLKPAMLSLGRKVEWLNLIDSLIEANAKRPNLLEILRRCK